MTKFSNISRILGVCIVIIQTPIAYSYEGSLEANIDARTEYNSNIFLTNQPHNGVSGLIVTPSLSGIVKEKNWEAVLGARIKSHNYSDDNINSNDQYFDLTGSFVGERNIFSLNANYDLASNLNSTSTDFGVVGRRINTKNQSVTPQYRRLLTERLDLILSYTYRDLEFLDAENTGFKPYITESGSGTLSYSLTERDKLTISLTAVDYRSKDESSTYQLFMSRFGIDHEFSETFSTDFLLGVSRQSSTNKQFITYDFLGTPVLVTEIFDANNRSLLLDVGVRKLFETGSIEGRISRDNKADSFGGLNEVNRLKVNYEEKLSELWRYRISGKIDSITAISANNGGRDRKYFFFESVASYTISKNWYANASYRYIQRRFKNDTSNRAPHSNRIYIGLTYNFPSLSTF